MSPAGARVCQDLGVTSLPGLQGQAAVPYGSSWGLEGLQSLQGNQESQAEFPTLLHSISRSTVLRFLIPSTLEFLTFSLPGCCPAQKPWQVCSWGWNCVLRYLGKSSSPSGARPAALAALPHSQEPPLGLPWLKGIPASLGKCCPRFFCSQAALFCLCNLDSRWSLGMSNSKG